MEESLFLATNFRQDGQELPGTLLSN